MSTRSAVDSNRPRVAAVVLALLAGASAACSPGRSRTAVKIVPGAGVPGSELAAAVSSLCAADQLATSRPDRARDTFYVQAHQRLHLEAQGLAEIDRPASGRLLVAMQHVEADFTSSPAGTGLAADLATLTSTAAAGLDRLAIPRPACARQ